MEAKVIVSFRDRITKQPHYKGSVYNGSPERIKELQGRGWLAETDEQAGDDNNQEGNNDDEKAAIEDFLGGSVDEIKEALSEASIEDFKTVLEVEKEGKNRKSLIEYIESNITESENEESD